MKQSLILSAILLITFSNFSCKTKHMPDGRQFDIQWEVVSNTFHERPKVKARFVIKNNSQFVLTDKNWTLFYNKSPRRPLKTHEEAGVSVELINGDWFRIVPLPGFSLLPGETVEIIYESRSWLIKEAEAPRGLYFVFTDEAGREKITEVPNIKILPFVRPEQTRRHLHDHEPFYSPEVSFQENLKMNLLAEEELLPLIPSPVAIEFMNHTVKLEGLVTIFYEDELKPEAEWLQNKLTGLTGLRFRLRPLVGAIPRNQSIILSKEDLNINGRTTESYWLTISSDNPITIKGSDRAGVFYGIQSLVALIPVDVLLGESQEITLPAVKIEDAPRFEYRGLHIDVSRNFQEKETIKKVLDLMAFYKLNVLHLHLTDDEGWRLEIPGLPELTQVGAQRGHTTKTAAALHPAFGSGPFPNAKGRFGCGYYSVEDYIEILRHANDLHIKVITEINLPGHARAAVKAMEARYERFMAEGNEEAANEFRLIDPDDTSKYSSVQFFTDNTVNVARESVYHFLEKVLDELIGMYAKAGAPLDIVHIGGDEVPRGAWSRSPMIDALMKTMPEITHPANMHVYFTRRALEIFRERNLRMAGWEEIALHKSIDSVRVVNPDFAGGSVIPFAYNNLWVYTDLAYRYANTGFPVVLCHVTNFYFDLAYNKDPKEPGLYWGGFIGAKEPWHYNPFNIFYSTMETIMGAPIDYEVAFAGMERLQPEARKNILGLQAQLWSETIFGQEMLEYYLLPKLIGFSESAWAQERIWETTTDPVLRNKQVQDGWNIFANTLARRELPRLSELHGGFNYRIPLPGAIIKEGRLHANI
ncbi:MAG TPA: family 20 glycosylhydrolase, partial [Bacteroidales bacterium]|nr:family 20 glycosylhydrolase [Bacteroidales bacterium]